MLAFELHVAGMLINNWCAHAIIGVHVGQCNDCWCALRMCNNYCSVVDVIIKGNEGQCFIKDGTCSVLVFAFKEAQSADTSLAYYIQTRLDFVGK